MNNQILINITPHETRIAIMELGVPQEIHIERSTARGLVGNIYLGRVLRVLPGMQSAFIDIGLEKSGFLHVAEIWAVQPNATPQLPIEQLLTNGQTIVVQVIKEPIGSKGARLTMQISLAGRYLVYLPQISHIGVSQKIESEEERSELKEKLSKILPTNLQGGFIIRTQAESSTTEELKQDVDHLTQHWQDIQESIPTNPTPSLLREELNLSQRILRDYANEFTEKILVDSKEQFQKLQQFAQHYCLLAYTRLEHYAWARPLFDFFGVEDEIEKALSRRVDLQSGGYLIIDQTEALTTIDVNTGAFVGNRNLEETLFKTNLEAAQAISRQLRLRNLGGIIIADFIDMNHESHQQAVLAELHKCLERDRTRLSVSGFTSLGLVEMTRKRTRESLARILCEPCPCCQGSAQIKTAQTLCYEILREVVRMSRQFDAQEYRIIAHHRVIELFLESESLTLASASEFIKKPIRLQAENQTDLEQYDIVLA